MSVEDFFGGPIFSYSRQQALDDGVLVDVSKMAKEAGFKYPVAVTRSVWDGLIVPDETSRQVGQDEQGRLWDVFFLLRGAIQQDSGGSEVRFSVIFLFQGTDHRKVTLKSVCGPDDDLAPCITIMLPEED